LTNKLAFTGLEQQARRLRTKIDFNISKVLDHRQFIMGPEVSTFERTLEEFCGAKHAIAVANGTDALQIALMVYGVGPGDAVFVPSFTYTATAEVILILGAIPVFVEVDPDTFNIDAADLEQRIIAAKAAGINARAIISVDLFGLPADAVALQDVADRHKLFLLSDAAQSFGGRDASGNSVGVMAPITTTSFFPAKPLGCYGDGGAIFTDDDEYANVMRSIRVHGKGAAKYETVRVGMNSRLDTIQAAVLLAKIEVYAEELAARNALADRYEARLGGIIRTPIKPSGATSAWAQYTIRLADRDAAQQQLLEAGIPTAIYYPLPMHLQPAYAAYGDGVGSLPISEQMSREVLSLPMNPYWTESDLDTVCSAVERVARVIETV
jgi:UDP-2-acetamido-2-deoxy-ribo-hexuluronate aminotransferase